MTKTSVEQLCYAELKLSSWMFQVIFLLLTNIISLKYFPIANDVNIF